MSRDTDNANGSINPIFDKEKEQNRLKEAQLIGEIGGQAMDIALTQGDIIGLEAALKANPTLKGDAEALRETKEYKAEMKKYGTGSALQQGLQAATAAIQGLAGGDMAKALAGASAPYLAEVIHNMTLDPTREGGINTEANLMAHAVLGAVVAQINGNSALAGASGAAMGEYIAQQMYPGINREDLTEEQRQTISALGTLAAGLAGGVVGNSTADAVAGALAGKNAVENNSLSVQENKSRTQEMAQCNGESGCEKAITQKYKELNAAQRESVVECKGAQNCVDKANEVGKLQGEYASRIDELSEKLRTENGLSDTEKNELAYLKAVLPQLEADRMTAIHNALMSGDSSEAKQLAINSLAQAGAAGAAGVAAGIGKGNSGSKGSAMPVPTPTTATNGLIYQSNGKHTPGQTGYNRNAGTEPANSIQLFGNSIPYGKKMYALDEQGNVHQFTNTNDGSWHWSVVV